MAFETDYAWAAGFVDGDGCVSLYAKQTRGRMYQSVALILVQKDQGPLEHFKRIFDLDYKLGVVSRRGGKDTYYRLSINGAKAGDVLEKIVPYLVLKQEVAKTAITLLGTSDAKTRTELVQKGIWLNSGRWAAAETKSEGLVC